MRAPFLAALLLPAFAAGAAAHEYALGPLTIDHPYARATAPGQETGVVYLAVVNRGDAADRLVRAATDAARSTEAHVTTMDAGGVVRMRPAKEIEVPPDGRAELRPGGAHLMLVGLKAPLVAGTRFPLTLTFAEAGAVRVEVAVEAPGAAAGHEAHGTH